jgi:hypothetical protein
MAVQGIIKYYVELRYSLMQNLYDAMFENVINGLPIARSMVRIMSGVFCQLLSCLTHLIPLSLAFDGYPRHHFLQ